MGRYLKFFWLCISNISGVIGLSSMFEGLITWKGFMLDLISYYQDLLFPVYMFLFSWFPMQIPYPLFDYLTLGLLVRTSIALSDSRILLASPWIVRTIQIVLLWPLLMISFTFMVFSKRKIAPEVIDQLILESGQLPNSTSRALFKRRLMTGVSLRSKEGVGVFQWLAVVMLGFVSMLLVNHYFL